MVVSATDVQQLDPGQPLLLPVCGGACQAFPVGRGRVNPHVIKTALKCGRVVTCSRFPQSLRLVCFHVFFFSQYFVQSAVPAPPKPGPTRDGVSPPPRRTPEGPIALSAGTRRAFIIYFRCARSLDPAGILGGGFPLSAPPFFFLQPVFLLS